MKGSQVHNLYPNSYLKYFNDYTLSFELKIFQIFHIRTVLRAKFLQIWFFLAYLEHLKFFISLNDV